MGLCMKWQQQRVCNHPPPSDGIDSARLDVPRQMFLSPGGAQMKSVWRAVKAGYSLDKKMGWVR